MAITTIALAAGEKPHWRKPMSPSTVFRLATVASALALAGCAGPSQTDAPLTVQMECGLLPITVTYAGERATVVADDLTLDLVATRSASGAKYAQADNEETYLWNKGERATLQIDGRSWPQCLTADTPPDPLEARGNEPFWNVSISNHQLALRTPANQDPTPVATQHQPITNGAHRFTARVDGLDLVLDVHPEVCRDTMSGMPYPYRAELVLDQAMAQGCAGDPERLLQGMEWAVNAINGQPVGGDVAATFQFFGDGLIAGRAFCNRFNGQYQLSGEGLRVGPLASTKMACPEPLMDLEHQLLQQLGQVVRFDILSPGELVLHTSEGQSISARTGEQAEP